MLNLVVKIEDAVSLTFMSVPKCGCMQVWASIVLDLCTSILGYVILGLFLYKHVLLLFWGLSCGLLNGFYSLFL